MGHRLRRQIRLRELLRMTALKPEVERNLDRHHEHLLGAIKSAALTGLVRDLVVLLIACLFAYVVSH